MTVVSDQPEVPVDYEARQKRKEAYEKSVDEIFTKWKKTDMLDVYPEKHQKKFAVILDNQRLLYESLNYAEPNMSQKLLGLVQKVLKGWIVPDIVSVQPLLGPAGNLYSMHHKATWTPYEDGSGLGTIGVDLKLQEQEIRAITRNLFKFQPKDFETDEALEVVATKIRNIITREVFTDLRNNAGTHSKRKVDVEEMDYESIFVNLCEVSGVIHRKTLRGGLNWIVAGPVIAKTLTRAAGMSEATGLSEDVFEKAEGPVYLGTLNARWRLYYDPLYPKDEMLVGYGDEEQLLDGYFYAPYIMLTQTPVILDPENFEPRFGLMSRYGKKLSRPGPKFYGKMTYRMDVDEKS